MKNKKLDKSSWLPIKVKKPFNFMPSKTSLSEYSQRLLDLPRFTEEENSKLIEKIIKDPSDENCWKLVLGNIGLVIYLLNIYCHNHIDDMNFMNGIWGMFRGAKRINRSKGWQTYLISYIYREITEGVYLKTSQLSPLNKTSKKVPLPIELATWGYSQENHRYPESSRIPFDPIDDVSKKWQEEFLKVDDLKFLIETCKASIKDDPYLSHEYDILMKCIAAPYGEKTKMLSGDIKREHGGEHTRAWSKIYSLRTRFTKKLTRYLNSDKNRHIKREIVESLKLS